VFSARFVFLHQFIPSFLPFFPYFDDMLWKRAFEDEKKFRRSGRAACLGGTGLNLVF